jgi:hypothetical protein
MQNNMPYANPDFYQASGALRPDEHSYIERAADRELLNALLQMQFCYILTPRQMGKTSLIARTKERLKAENVSSVQIDLSSIGKSVSVEQWYLGQINIIVRELQVKTDYIQWWQQHSYLGEVQRFGYFLTDVILTQVAEPIVIFVDEIDTTLSLPVTFNTDDYFAAIRAFYNERAFNPSLQRLSFVLVGVAAPSDLIKDTRRTPFNIGRRIVLTDFLPEEAKPLMIGLAPDRDLASYMLEQILVFTGGHPYLTQQACKRIAEWAKSSWNITEAPVIVDELVAKSFLSDAGRNTDSNLQFVRTRILGSPDAEKLLRLYRRVRRGDILQDNELDPLFVALKLSGLVKTSDAEIVIVRNHIYKLVFDEHWISAALSETGSRTVEKPEILYDVFISYSQRDSTWVISYLIPALQTAGLSVCSENFFTPGSNLNSETEKALIQSRDVLVGISPDYLASQFTLFEKNLYLSLSTQRDQPRRIIPLLLKGTVDLPPILATYTPISFAKEDERESSMQLLLNVLDAPHKNAVKQNVPLRSSQSKHYDTSVIRTMLDEAFDNDELMDFIFDHFRPLYDQLSPGTPKKDTIQNLIAYAEEKNLFESLLDYVARKKPRQYRRFAGKLEIDE